MFRDGVLSVLSLVLALALALVVGGFLGWSTHPDRTAALDVAHMEMARSGVTARTIEELQKIQYERAEKHPGFHSPQPHTVVAILKSHPLLLGAFSLGLLCLFRPSRLSIAAVFVPAAVASYLVIGPRAALTVLAATILFIGWSVIYARFSQR